MKKSEIARQYDFNATTMFLAAAVALVTNSVITALTSSFDAPNYVKTVGQVFAVAFVIFAYVMTIKGFGSVDKACRLSEENENYYMGKNLKVMTIISLVLTALIEIVVLFLYMLLSRYNTLGSLSEADITAANNLKIITAIVLIAAQLVAISMPYIIYLWKIHSVTPKTDSINNFALLTMIIMVVQLAIGILSAVYAIKGSQTSFLSGFSEILLTLKYVVLLLFFITRRKGLGTAKPEENKE